MSQGSLNPKIRFLGQKVWPVARAQTHRQTDRVTTEGTLSGFQGFFLQLIIKDRPNKQWSDATCIALYDNSQNLNTLENINISESGRYRSS